MDNKVYHKACRHFILKYVYFCVHFCVKLELLLPKSGQRDVQKSQSKSSIKVENPSRSEIYDREKRQIFIYINNLITKLSVENGRLMCSSNIYTIIQSLIIYCII